jgi:hypothetical protein
VVAQYRDRSGPEVPDTPQARARVRPPVHQVADQPELIEDRVEAHPLVTAFASKGIRLALPVSPSRQPQGRLEEKTKTVAPSAIHLRPLQALGCTQGESIDGQRGGFTAPGAREDACIRDQKVSPAMGTAI